MVANTRAESSVIDLDRYSPLNWPDGRLLLYTESSSWSSVIHTTAVARPFVLVNGSACPGETVKRTKSEGAGID